VQISTDGQICCIKCMGQFGMVARQGIWLGLENFLSSCYWLFKDMNMTRSVQALLTFRANSASIVVLKMLL